MADFSIHPGTHPGSIHLTIRDLERSLRFYVDTLGLRTLRQEDGRAILGTADGTPLVGLVASPGAVPRPPRTTGLYHLALLLPTRRDLARALRRLAEVRYPLGGASDHLVSEALYLDDPDGIGIEIYADRPRETWPRQQGELRMATNLLDVESLMAELGADATPWTGAPPETRLGHVHLQVADIPSTEVFYRDALGFELVVRYGPSASFLAAGGYHHHLGANTWTSAGAPPPPPEAVGLRYFTLRLPEEADMRRVVQHLRQVGQVPLAVEDRPEAAFLRDPSGNGILLEYGTL